MNIRTLAVLALVLALAAPSYAQPNDAITSGNLTAPAQAVTLNLNRYGTATVQVTGTWTGTIEFEATANGTTYVAMPAIRVSDQTVVSNTTANGTFVVAISGFQRVRARASALGSGSAAVTVVANATATTLPVAGGASSSVTVTNGAGAAAVNIQDGGNSITVDATSLPLPTDAATETTLAGVATEATQATVLANQTNGTQQTKITDGTDVANVTGTSLDVTCTSGCSATSFLDKATFTFGTTPVVPMGAVLDDVSTNTMTENTAGVPRMSVNRVLYSNLRNDAGTLTADVNDTASGWGSSATSLMVGGYHNSGIQLALPISPGGWSLPDGNSYAVSVSLRDSTETEGSALRRLTFTPVGGVSDVGSAVRFNFSGGNHYTGVPTNTMSAQVRDFGQTLAKSGSMTGGTGVGGTYTNRVVNYSGNLWFLSPSVGFTGTVRPVISLNGATNYSPTLAVNVLTGETVTSLVSPTADAVYVIPACGGATECGWEMTAWTTGTLAYRASATTNGTISSFSTSVVPGTGATNLGKAEDAAHTSGDTGVSALAVRKDGTAQTTGADGDYATTTVDAYGALRTTHDHANRIACAINSTATTSTTVTGCTAPGAGLSIYITGLQWSSSVTSTVTDYMTIQDGTGGNCAAATTVRWEGYAQAFTTVPVVFQQPLKVDANSEVCFVHAGAGQRTVNIQGFIAP